MSTVMFLRLLARAPLTRRAAALASACAAPCGIGICLTPVRYCPVSDCRVGHHLCGRAFGDDLAAMDAGAGADIDDIVGGQDRVLVMLDDDHRVAEVAQVVERFEQPRIVALVQADRRLVEHVEHAGEAGADLRGEADALALAARQRAASRGEGEIVEADIDEEAQPLADLLQDARRRSRSASA